MILVAYPDKQPLGMGRFARHTILSGLLSFLVISSIMWAVWLPAALGADNCTVPGPFFFQDRGNAWFFLAGGMDCWSGNPNDGCPEDTVTLLSEGSWIHGKTNHKIHTPTLRYIRFQAMDSFVPCDPPPAPCSCYYNAIHCGPVAYRLIVDGEVVASTGLLGPSATTGAQPLGEPIPEGEHNIRVKLIGNPTGCQGNQNFWSPAGFWVESGWGAALWLWEGKPRQDLAGNVTQLIGPMAGISIEAQLLPDGRSYNMPTAANGTFSFNLPIGDYLVKPRSPYGGPVFDPEKRRVHLNKDVAGVNFSRVADELDLETKASDLYYGLYWTRAAASGGKRLPASAKLKNFRGEPVNEQIIKIDAPYWDVAPSGSTEPEIVMCDESWRRVYPGSGFERYTDATGKIRFTVFMGGNVGNYLLHAYDSRDAAVFDIERFAQTGDPVGPDPDIVTTLQNATKMGYPKPPLAGATQAAVQEGLLDWLLWYRFVETLGPDALSPWGEFGPIRTANGSRGAIILYPSGNAAPLRQHLRHGDALPPGYRTLVLPIKKVVVLAKYTWYVDFGGGKGLPSLSEWETEFGRAYPGFAGRDGGNGPAWFGGPYPPPSTDATARTAFNRCLPGAAPKITAIEVHSPVKLLVKDSKGNRFGYNKDGSFTDEIGGIVFPQTDVRPATYLVPSGYYEVSIRGTGTGVATLVVRSPGQSGDSVKTFSFRSGSGKSGKLNLSPAGAASTLVFGGRTITAQDGVSLSIRGLPLQFMPRQRVRLRVRVLSRFGSPVEGALVTIMGRNLEAKAMTSVRGRALIRFRVPRLGRVTVKAAAPGYIEKTKRVPIAD